MFFDNDLERIAGWNDGNKIVIDSSALASPIVQSHEAIHGRIFQETSDGQVHKLCCEAAKSHLDQRYGGIFGRISKLLFVQTRDAHEAGATYLAIQGLPNRKLRKEELRNIAKSYKRYYTSIAELIDPIAKTSWLRFAFGWTLIHWSFSSTRARSFFADTTPSIKPFEDIASPTQRFQEAVRFLKKSRRLRTWAHESISAAENRFESSGRVLWDLQDEHAWDNHQDHESLQLFESNLTSAAGDWLLDNLPIETEDFRIDQPFGPGFDHIMRELKYLPTRMHTGPDCAIDNDWKQWNTERLGIAHGGDSINHQPTCDPVDISLNRPDDMISKCVLALQNSSHCSFLCDLREPEKVTLLCREGTADTAIESYAYRDVGSYLISVTIASHLIRNVLARKAEFNPDLSIWMLIRTTRINILEAAMLVLTLAGEKGSEGLLVESLPLSRVIFYLDSPWNELYHLGPEVGSQRIGLLDSPGGEVKPISLRFAKPPTPFPAYLMSAKPDMSGYRLDQYEALLASRGTIKKIELSEAELRVTLTPFLDAWHVWRQF